MGRWGQLRGLFFSLLHFLSLTYLLSSQSLFLSAAITSRLRDCLPAYVVVEDHHHVPTLSLFYPASNFLLRRVTEHTSPPIICARPCLAARFPNRIGLSLCISCYRLIYQIYGGRRLLPLFQATLATRQVVRPC